MREPRITSRRTKVSGTWFDGIRGAVLEAGKLRRLSILPTPTPAFCSGASTAPGRNSCGASPDRSEQNLPWESAPDRVIAYHESPHPDPHIGKPPVPWLLVRHPGGGRSAARRRRGIPSRSPPAGRPGELTRLAGAELVDYVRKLSGADLSQVAQSEAGRAGDSWILLGVAGRDGDVQDALRSNGGPGAPLKAEGFVLRTGTWKDHPAVIIAGGDEAGVLYGTYELLERLGITFRLTGDILPAKQNEVALQSLDLRREPALKRRGFLFPVNFDNASSYSWSDYETMLNQMARMKCNYLQFWWFRSSRGSQYSYKGEPMRSLGTFPRRKAVTIAGPTAVLARGPRRR